MKLGGHAIATSRIRRPPTPCPPRAVGCAGQLAPSYSEATHRAATASALLAAVPTLGSGDEGITRAAAVAGVLERRMWQPARAEGGQRRRRLALSPALSECAHASASSSVACGAWVELEGRGDGNALHAVAIVDPLSPSVHRIASLLIALRSALGLRVSLLLAAPPPGSDEAAATEPSDAFHAVACQLDPTRIPTATLEMVRTGGLTLTLMPDAPSDWLLALHSTSDDLDNLQLSNLPLGQPVHASYSVAALLVTGQCSSAADRPQKAKGRRGLLDGSGQPGACHAAPLELRRTAPDATTTTADAADTASRATLALGGGYFQIKGSPGLWELQMPRGGQLTASAQRGGKGGGKGGGKRRGSLPPPAVHVPILSYSGARVDVRVDGSGASATAEPPTTAGRADDDGRVHVFSLASGSLYERFLRIMMRSAAERCTQPITFWLLGNFLSPSLRASIASGALAAAIGHGARVAVVQYAWPAHLRMQTEKQRLIWGYKILFLDVLFPLHLSKVTHHVDTATNAPMPTATRPHAPSCPCPCLPACSSTCVGDLRRRRPDCPRGPRHPLAARLGRRAHRHDAVLPRGCEQPDDWLPLLDVRLLGESSRQQAVPHLRPLHRRPHGLPCPRG